MMKWTLLAAVCSWSLSFVSDPVLVKNSPAEWTVEFTVSESTDVAVSIVNIGDSTVIRNLAAGVLGSNPPSPLQPGTLHQVLTWDGRDNYGQAVTLPDSVIRGRVRAGMTPKLAAFMGGDPYAFAPSFNGLRLGPDNTVYVVAANAQGITGGYTGGNRPIRRFDLNGNYLQTVFPPRADLPLDSVSAYGVNAWADGGWSPVTGTLNFGTMTQSLLTEQMVQLVSNGMPDELVFGTIFKIQTLRISGAAAPQDTPKSLYPDIPAANWRQAQGPVYYTLSHDPRYLYLSGRYGAAANWDACDTGLWADGQVYRVEKATGHVQPWLTIDSVPVTAALRGTDICHIGGGNNFYFSAIHGTAIDDSGHVFVCDRVNKRIGVYDTNAVLLGSVPVHWPDIVAIDEKTGEIYVVTRNNSEQMLYKFSGWRGVSAPEYSISLGAFENAYGMHGSMVLVEKDGRPHLWIGADPGHYGAPLFLKEYVDDGAKFAFVKDILKPLKADDLVNFNRIWVDRRNETVFIQDRNEGLYKITDWSSPAAVRCSTSANQPMKVDDMAIDPRRGLLYVHEITPYPGTFKGPITRWTLDRLHAPAPFANTGDNMLTPYVQTGDVQGHPSKGMDISLTGNTLVCMSEYSYGGFFFMGEYPDTGSHDTLACDTLVVALPGQSGGTKYDLKNNYYCGTKTRSADHVIPSGFASDYAYQAGVGSVIKYQAGTRGHSIGAWTSSRGIGSNPPPTDALKVYAPGFAPFGGNMTNGCSCTSPRFDIDYYGRLFIPNAVTKQVTITDNNGNTIAQFGKYGNLDSRGGLLGTGIPVAVPEIPLAYPVSAAASEDFIYVGDFGNWRMMRVRMDYTLDNLPGITGNAGGMAESANPPFERFALSSAPNPFNPQSRISVYLPKTMQATLAVYELSGRLVRTLVSRTLQQGVHHFVWNGEGAASGMYVYRLTAGKRVLNLKTIFAK